MNIPPAGPAGPAAPAPQFTPQPKTSGMAIASVILAVVGLFCIPVVGPLLAALLGLIAIFSIKGSQGRSTGTGLAALGLILGLIGFLIHGTIIGGAIYVTGQIVKAAKEFEGQMRAVSAAAEKGDWEGVAKELTGPGSPTKEEIAAKFQAAEGKYGKLTGFDLAQTDADQAELQKDVWSFAMKLVFNVKGEKGDCHLVVNAKRRGGKLQVTGLEFKDGHVAKTIDKSGGDWDD